MMDKHIWQPDEAGIEQETAIETAESRMNANAYKTKYRELMGKYAKKEAELTQLHAVSQYQDVAIQAERDLVKALHDTIATQRQLIAMLKGPDLPEEEG